MTQPCDSCGQPSPEPTCLRCQAEQGRLATDTTYPAWSSSTAHPGASERQLARAKADLLALPDLVAELALCLTERGAPSDGGGHAKVTGSPAPMRLDVLHLVDEREKPLWWGEDPREADLQDRYGVLWSLASWSRVISDEMPDAPYLAETPTVVSEVQYLASAWDWISQQQWADELCQDVSSLAAQCRSSLGIRREYRPRCRYCRNTVVPVDADGQPSTWDLCAYGRCTGCEATFAPGPELATLGKVQAPMTLTEVAETTGIPRATLRKWRDDEWIRPAVESDGRVKGRYDLAEVVAVHERLGNVKGRAS